MNPVILINEYLREFYLILYISLSINLITSSCEDQLKIEGFDSETWKKDGEGCSGKRKEQLQVLLDSKEKIAGNSEQRIMNFLGSPDRNDLYTRRQKFFIYYIDPGPHCPDKGTRHEMLIIRFNATGYANEVYSQDGFSTK
jgi:hypothetical protein